MKYRFGRLANIEVSLDSIDPDSSAPIVYSGDKTAISIIRSLLESNYGYYGHFIGDRTTPIDLHSAMNQPDLQAFNPDLVEGSEIIADYKSPIPTGSTS